MEVETSTVWGENSDLCPSSAEPSGKLTDCMLKFYIGSIKKLLQTSITLHWETLHSPATHTEQMLLLMEEHLTFMLASKLRQLHTFNWIPTSPNTNLEQRSYLLRWWQTAEPIVHNFWNCLFNFKWLFSTNFSKPSVVTGSARTLLAQAEEYEL